MYVHVYIFQVHCIFDIFQTAMGTRVYIGHLSYHARERDVERFFKGYGRIRDVMLKNGYGFVVSFFCNEVIEIKIKKKDIFITLFAM